MPYASTKEPSICWKEPHMSAKEAPMSAEEPYMSAKERYRHANEVDTWAEAPWRRAKEPYKCVKEPHISAKELAHSDLRFCGSIWPNNTASCTPYKELNIWAKEPYIFAKRALYIEVFGQIIQRHVRRIKSSTYEQKSPIYLPKEPYISKYLAK